MNQLNSLIIEGNVVRAPERRTTPRGFNVCTVPVAVNRFYKDTDGKGVSEVSFFEVEAFGKTAELCADNCEKGRGVRIVGRLRQNRWTDKDGKGRSRVTIIAEHVEFKKNITKPEPQEDLSAIAEANRASVEEEVAMEQDMELAAF
ncbi:MAG: single-stranded DNA-binding protein [Treponemataceae bacterium]|nr:single-stranded DNA-binding protein [Treponemataceae bacterium]